MPIHVGWNIFAVCAVIVTVGLQVLLVDMSYPTWIDCKKCSVITNLTAKICILQCYYNMLMFFFTL